MSDGSVEGEVDGEVDGEVEGEVEFGPDQGGIFQQEAIQEETIQQENIQQEVIQDENIQEEIPPWFLRPRTTWAKNEHPYELKYTGMVRPRSQCPRTSSAAPFYRPGSR